MLRLSKPRPMFEPVTITVFPSKDFSGYGGVLKYCEYREVRKKLRVAIVSVKFRRCRIVMM